MLGLSTKILKVTARPTYLKFFSLAFSLSRILLALIMLLVTLLFVKQFAIFHLFGPIHKTIVGLHENCDFC